MRNALGLVVLCTAPAVLLLAYFRPFGGRQTDYDSSVPARVAARGERIPTLVKCRENPVKVEPNPGLASLVSEEQMIVVLNAALPWWSPPTVPSAIHELKLWGRNAVFTKEMIPAERTGQLLIATLLSDKLCRANTTPFGGSYLLDSRFGIRPVLAGSEDAVENRAESHYGQLLQVLGEVGEPSTAPVTTSSGRVGTLADIYQDGLMRFSFAQELEFIACALAYWHPPLTSWKDQFGNDYNFDQLLSRLTAIPLGKGSCGGCHVPYAVVTILRVDQKFPILSEASRIDARQWLGKLSRLLEDRWSASAGWDKSWSQESQNGLLWNDDLLDRITITGHHLEWIALAPQELRPSEVVVRRAVQALLVDIRSLPPLGQQLFKTLLPVSHAARALALLRGEDPYSVWLRYWKGGRMKRTSRGLEIRRFNE